MGALKWYNPDTSDWEYVQLPGGANSFVYKEPISGANGSTTAFTTVRGYVSGTLQVFVNGLAQGPTHISETTPSTGSFSLDVAPLTGDIITVNYQINIPASGNSDTLDGEHLSSILQAVYPVGAVFVSGSSTMPVLIASVGTWARLDGRVIVGVDTSQTEFDTVNETGGAKTHTLTTTEMPSHNHTIKGSTGAGSFAEGVAFGNDSTPDFTNAGPINSAGGGGAHNNLQPYKTKYMWERTA